MQDEIVKVENGGVTLALGRFATGLRQRTALLKEIAAGMLVSVRRTFREQGSPEGSWAPLAASTLRKKPNGSGRKILIVSGRLLNSIQATSDDHSVTLGTNLVYARVQQEGSADRSGAAIGPQARIAGRAVLVAASHRSFQREIHYGLRTVAGRDGQSHQVPVGMRTGMRDVTDARGRNTKVRTAFQGPRLQQQVAVGEHNRFQNIPARPYLVFRPEDPARLQAQVIAFGARAALQAGLQTGGAR